MKVITSKMDTAIILLTLVIFFLIALGGFINTLVHKSAGTALLFGLVGLGIFDVIKDVSTRLSGGRRKKK